MLPNTKNMLIGSFVGVVIGAVATGSYCWMSSGSKDTGTGTGTSYPVTGGAKTKHNRNHKKHNNKSRKHH